MYRHIQKKGKISQPFKQKEMQGFMAGKYAVGGRGGTTPRGVPPTLRLEELTPHYRVKVSQRRGALMSPAMKEQVTEIPLLGFYSCIESAYFPPSHLSGPRCTVSSI